LIFSSRAASSAAGTLVLGRRRRIGVRVEGACATWHIEVLERHRIVGLIDCLLAILTDCWTRAITGRMS
jgi:hypothetical protein